MNGIVNIHGKDYMTVARRVELAHEDRKLESVVTEVIAHQPVVIKATITVEGRIFTGISAANPSKSIEKQSPYEVAETSAVGRALGFAGYGIVESIASADEMAKATKAPPVSDDVAENGWCEIHKTKLYHYEKEGREWWSHKCADGTWCNGRNNKTNVAKKAVSEDDGYMDSLAGQ